jgi:hypothetical protein
MTTRHPLSFLRGIVYHAKVGMLNPIPALQNATQMANAVAISPVHGTAGFTFGLMSYFGRLNSRPGILSALGEIAEKATGGKYKKEWFIDAQRALRDSGYLEIGGSHALGDYLNEPKFYQRKFGKALDASSVLFTQSEKLLSSSAYMTSYLEFRSANPTKVLTSIDYNEILNRANLYAGRMRRNDKARWQSGEVLSSFTQFWSYPARLMEMIWEKGHGRKDMLTGAEKLRLLAANSILYGIPIGLGGTAVGGVFNTYDYMKQKFSENGIDTDSGTLAKLFDGVVGTMSKNAVGVNLSPTFGPIGRDLTQTLEQDNGWFRFILGPTGGTFLDTIHSAKPAYRSAWMAVNGELKPSVLAGDLLNIARNVSSINKMTAMYLAYKNKNIYTKMGQPMTNEIGGEGKLDTWTALVSAITGQVPSEIDHDMWHMKILSNLTEVKQDLAKQAQQDYRLHLQAEAEGNRDLSMFYLRRSSILLGGMPMRERLEIIKKSMDGDKALIDTIEKKWEQHDPTVTDHFIETYGEYFKNAPKKETE